MVASISPFRTLSSFSLFILLVGIKGWVLDKISLPFMGDEDSEVESVTEGSGCGTFEFNDEDDIGHPLEVLAKERLVAEF